MRPHLTTMKTPSEALAWIGQHGTVCGNCVFSPQGSDEYFIGPMSEAEIKATVLFTEVRDSKARVWERVFNGNTGEDWIVRKWYSAPELAGRWSAA